MLRDARGVEARLAAVREALKALERGAPLFVAPVLRPLVIKLVEDGGLPPDARRCLLEHWTYVLTKYNSRFGLRFLDLPATLALLDAKARGEVAVGV